MAELLEARERYVMNGEVNVRTFSEQYGCENGTEMNHTSILEFTM